MTSAVQTDAQQRIREQAAQRFQQLGWPTTRDEEWQYTSLAPIVRWRERGAPTSSPATRAGAPQNVDTRGFSLCGRAIVELVFVNGVYAPEACSGATPVGIRVTTMCTADSELLEKHFARYADYQNHALTALNTASGGDGAAIEVEETFAGFVHLLFVSDGAAESHPRNLIVAHRGSQIAVVETYVGSGSYFTNAVTEIVAAEGAVVDHYKIVYESLEAFHVGTVQIHQQRSSSVTARSVAIGGALVRNETNGVLAGEGASLVLDGLFTPGDAQHIDNHTIIDHAVPHCESIELYKGILDGSGRGVFDGRIIVRPDARKTISRQTNHNLLLSDLAIVDSKPTLEIHNDDVKCNHGSTIGRLDEQALFYLRSRGIDEAEARNLLVHAFASEIVDRMKIEPVREHIRRAMFDRMPHRMPERRER